MVKESRCLFALGCLGILSVSSLHSQSTALPTFKSNQIVVRFDSKMNPVAVQGLNSRLGVTSSKLLSKKMNAYQVNVPAGSSVETLIEAYDAQGGVVYAEPDYDLEMTAIPNDPRISYLWGLHNTGQQNPPGSSVLNAGTPGKDIDAPEAWEIRSSAENVIVAVVDTGINYRHEDLKDNLWKNPGESGLDANGKDKATNGVDDDKNGYVDDLHGLNSITGNGNPLDDHGHGSHCAGTIGASGNNGVGISGVCQKVKLMGCKFLTDTGSGSTSDAVECIDYARTHGAKVISNSWGGGGYSQALYDAIEACRKEGIIFVVAAGNSHLNIDQLSYYPAGYLLDNIVTVGAMDHDGKPASFSNSGSGTVHLFAPGVEIYSAWKGGASTYNTISGTSMATPHVSGAAALLKAQFPLADYHQLINRLLRGTIKGGFNAQTGGMLNLQNALKTNDARPWGDNLIEAISLKGNGVTGRASNAYATYEADEIAHAGVGGGRSIWFRWEPRQSGKAEITTLGSNFDTCVDVYSKTSGSIKGLGAPVVGNDNDSELGVKTSKVSFQVEEGKSYLIAVDGKNGETGTVGIQCNIAAANDDFASAMGLSGANVGAEWNNAGSTSEMNEPLHAENNPTRSVWFAWTAPQSGIFTVETFGSKVDTLLGVYTGETLAALTPLAGNDDNGKVAPSQPAKDLDLWSTVTIRATAGTTYKIAVDGYRGEQGVGYLRIYAGDWRDTPVPPDLDLPKAPSNLTVAASNGRAILNWVDKSSNETGFEVLKQIVGSGGYIKMMDLPANSNSFVDNESVIPGTTYKYLVNAKNGVGSAGTEAVFYYGVIPATPTNLMATSISTNSVKLRWDLPSSSIDRNNIDSYEIERKSAFEQYQVIGTTVRSSVGTEPVVYEDLHYVAGTYSYRVRAKNASGYSTYSSEVTATIASAGVPDKPKGLHAKLLSNGISAQLSWTPSGGGTDSYVLERKVSGGTYAPLATLPHRQLIVTYIDSAVISGQTYVYRVKAHNAAGYSPYSGQVILKYP